MNLGNEIVDEIRAAREVYSARFNYDLAEMFKNLKAKEAYTRNIASLQAVGTSADTPVAN